MDKEVLENVPKKVVNMVSGMRGSTYEEKLEELNMLTVVWGDAIGLIWCRFIIS